MITVVFTEYMKTFIYTHIHKCNNNIVVIMNGKAVFKMQHPTNAHKHEQTQIKFHADMFTIKRHKRAKCFPGPTAVIISTPSVV